MRPSFFFLFPAILLFSSPAAARRTHRSAEEPVHETCTRKLSDDEAQALRSVQEPVTVRLSGLRSLDEDSVWKTVGGRPVDPIPRDEVIALVVRLHTTGLFAAIVPSLDSEGIELALTENESVRTVRLRGLSEFRSEDVLDRLLETPSSWDIERSRRDRKEADAAACPEVLPSRDFFARVEDGEPRPGILWKGLRGALDRVAGYLRGRGYPLARLEGNLSPSGILQIDVDEGRLSGVEVRGLDAGLARDVTLELGLVRGDVFSTGELSSALERVERRWPFLRADRKSSRRRSTSTEIRIDALPDGGAEFRSEPLQPSVGAEDEDERPRPRRKHRERSTGSWYGFDGDKLIVYLRAERSRGDVQWIEILRHTPVTGFAPGLAVTATVYDPKDRVHLLLDGAVNINTRRSSRHDAEGTFLERLGAQEKVDWLIGARLRIPALAIAELGGQIHTLTDTSDRWRISNVDSYLYSALINRADREYYRRSGYAAILTTHLFDMLTLGAEYRRDQYDPLPAPPGVWTLFNKDEPLYGSAPADSGEIGSVLLRVEYRSEKVPLHRVGSMWRNSETSLLPVEPGVVGIRSLDTVEIADPSLGGIFHFTKIVSDSFLVLETGPESTLTLRARAGFGHGLPLQKQEGLGGWTALRGYDFKEFRGDASLLGTLSYEGRHFGVFFDAGSVRQTGNWLDPKTSAGASFSFAEGSTRMEAAWRLDSRAKALPDFRILFAVPL
ncbi:MAG: hypothetical protein ACJ79T_06725 [Myxococcales bacterium]